MRKYFIIALLALSLMGSCLWGTGQIFLTNTGGGPQEVAAAQTGGAGNANLIPALDASGRLDNSMMPVGSELNAAYSIIASETIAAGAPVNIWNNAGTINVRNADATTNGKQADGFILVGATNGVAVNVYLGGINTACSGLTPGARYWLGTTPGTITTTPPSTTGNLVQIVGKAINATTLAWQPQIVCTKA